jgi:cytochrome c-type biogenesis protein CcmH
MIQRRVEELVAAGYDKGQIEDYFIDKYGEWILLEPPPEGLNLLIWVAPGTALTLGMFGVLATYRRPREALTFETKAPTETDSYEAKLLEELDNDF